jgi:hypothetical protein
MHGLARSECGACGASKLFVRRDTSVVIRLTPGECEIARDRALRVVHVDTKAGWQMKFDPGGETRLGVNERGFGAEIAAARATGLPWNDAYLDTAHYKRSDKPPDIGRRTEVRNALRGDGRLVSHKPERTDWVYLLVTGALPIFRVVGWLEGRDLRVPDRWREPPAVKYPGYFASQHELNPLPVPGDA